MAENTRPLALVRIQRLNGRFRFSLLHQHHAACSLAFISLITLIQRSDPKNLTYPASFSENHGDREFPIAAGVEFPGFQNINRIITQVQSTQLCV